MNTKIPNLSRRGLFRAAIAGGGVLIAAAVVGSKKASAKVSQRAVAYRGAPSGKARCANCSQWQPPASCKVVSGVISPNAWCSIYAPGKA